MVAVAGPNDFDPAAVRIQTASFSVMKGAAPPRVSLGT